MAVTTYEFGEIKKSIQDLTRIYKPKPENVDQFVIRFIKKYHIARGYRSELIKIVLEELENLKS